jgi:hypothetical protein
MYKKLIPLWLGQPNYAECWIEKDAMAGSIDSIIKNRIRVAPNRGWSSLEFVHKNMERLQSQIQNQPEDFQGIKDIWILYVGDFDPSGLKMDGHYQKALAELQRRLAGQVQLHFKRIALTWDQITEFKLEHLKNAALSDKDWEKLQKDPNAEWFIKQYGSLRMVGMLGCW